ncbi:MAG: prephenate dehydratase [Sulfolobaceae archaeon]|nr:prephenate dehydratase [Sulfolobaceae archaeon]
MLKLENDPNGIYYLGPKGSFSDEASQVLNISGNRIPIGTITDVFSKVNETNGIGVVPIENSLEGPVGETLDNLFRYDNIFVNYEIILKIRLVLASKGKEPKRVYSHPHALQEARNYLIRSKINNIIPVESTSKAAELASKDLEAAAICSEYAAKLYNLDVLEKDIQDSENYTRFLVISKEKRLSGAKTMLLFTVEDKPGALYKVLEKFYTSNINITMIYSRPLRTLPWHYYFFLEYQGDISSNDELFRELSTVTKDLKVKGSYTTLYKAF